MSRIIVKQLPKNINEKNLRNLFGSKGTVTDIQLKYTPDGKFRQFCFIGYRSEEEAQAAVKHFHNSFVQAVRIIVELCAPLGSESKPKSWSKYSKDCKINEASAGNHHDMSVDKEKPEKKKKVSKIDEIVGQLKNDPEFQEFIKTHDKTRNLWANDAGISTPTDNDQERKSDSEDDAIENNKKVLNKPKETAAAGAATPKANAENENCDDEIESDDETDNEENVKLAGKPISDLDYMKSLMAAESTTLKGKENEQQVSCKQNDKSKMGKTGLDLYTIKIHNVPYKTKRQDILKFFKPLRPYSVRLPTNARGFCYVGFRTENEMTKGMLKNKSFIKGKQVFFSDFTEKNKITKSKLMANADDGATTTGINPKWQQQEDGTRNEENISESGKIFFRNLPYTTTEEDLQQLFEKFGPVAEIHLPVDTITRQIKGFGTVTFVMPEHAVQAFNKLDGTDFHGRLLHLIPGKTKETADDVDENDANLSFKQKKSLKLKKTAQQAITWNTLFLGPNAVAEILSKKFNMSKDKILDTNKGGSSAAVRIALGETEIVIEMKRFLEENGVCLSAFDTPTVKRSKTVILAKNLPADTVVGDLTPIFSKFGPIGRIVLPPSGVTALIEYCDPSEARQAFKKVAFSKFKTVPLFLEWAPEHAFTTTLTGEPSIPKQEEPALVKAEIADSDNSIQTETSIELKPMGVEEELPEDGDDPPEANTTLFLRNLNFKTVQETVYEHFKHLGTVHTVEIAKRKDAQNPRNMVSSGYGFIQFKKAAIAEVALKRMQLTTIDGNQVELKRSDRILKSANTTRQQRNPNNHTKQTGSKIMVRNIPFQAKTVEVRSIFKAFGELRTVRLPMKMTPGENTHRGFGFVDFVTKSDAKKAFEALSESTHLYGRRLVLEWASTDDEDVHELRKRTAHHFNSSGGPTAEKQSKRAVFDTDAHIQSLTSNNDEEDEAD